MSEQCMCCGEKPAVSRLTFDGERSSIVLCEQCVKPASLALSFFGRVVGELPRQNRKEAA